MTSTRVDPATIRLRGIAAILACGVQRFRDSVDVPIEDPTVSQNLADSLPEPLEIFADPSLSVSHENANVCWQVIFGEEFSIND